MPNAVPSQAIPLFDAGNFEEVYAASLATPISVVENQFKQLLWNETPVQVNTPATKPELQTVLDVLQKIEPGLKELKITRQEAPSKYPELMKVLQNHTRSTDYMIQFVKSPLCITPPRICDCKACTLGLFEPLRMPMEAYEKVHSKLFPLPIPQARPDESGELRYLSLEDTMALPFTDEHQPSKKEEGENGCTSEFFTRLCYSCPQRQRQGGQSQVCTTCHCCCTCACRISVINNSEDSDEERLPSGGGSTSSGTCALQGLPEAKRHLLAESHYEHETNCCRSYC